MCSFLYVYMQGQKFLEMFSNNSPMIIYQQVKVLFFFLILFFVCSKVTQKVNELRNSDAAMRELKSWEDGE